MAHLFYNISQVLGITIIHSLWQGLLIYFTLRMVFSSMPSLSSAKKYNWSVLALLGMAGWFVYTFFVEANAYDWSQATGAYLFSAALSVHAIPHPDFKTTLYTTIKSYLPYVSIIYAIGLIVNIGRLGLAWNNIRIIKKDMISGDNLQQRINEISRQLNITRYVKVSFSRLVDVPCVIGYLKPVLLLPITLTFRLSAEEIEAILLHELSHIKGNDYLVNMVQQIISVLLFFNPFAQLISHVISSERENRCDDVVVQTINNPLTYAYALLKLEETRQQDNVKLALAATQSKHHLLTRIERIMQTKKPIASIRIILLAVLLIAGSLSSIAWLNPEIKNGKIAFKRIASTAYAVSSTNTIVWKTAYKLPAVPPHITQLVTPCADTSLPSRFTDTNKKAKIKIVVEDENGKKKEYNSVNDMPESVRNDFYKENPNANFKFNMDRNFNFGDSSRFWKKQVEDIQDKAIAMSKRFNSPEFKKQVEQMEKKAKAMGEEMQKKFSSPEWKKQQEDMQKQGADMEKYYNSPEWKKQVEDMQKQGADMDKYYNSPEWKKQVEDLAKQGAELGTKYVNSLEFKRMQEDIVKQALEIAKQVENTNWNFNYDLKQTNEKPEKPEKPEPPKKITTPVKEKPGPPEKPEPPKKPVLNN
jgi:bla regulator protein BlaR1